MLNLNKLVLFFGLIGGLCAAFYYLGRSHSEVRIIREQGEAIIKEVEVIKYVEKEKAKIWSKPNAGRNELLKLMHNGEL